MTDETAWLLWLDLEMTGLNVKSDEIVEVAYHMTDLRGTKMITGTSNLVAYTKPLSTWCQDMFEKNGLLEDQRLAKESGTLKTITQVDDAAAGFVVSTIADFRNGHVFLAGASVHSDLKFVSKYMPKLAALVDHSRLFDISTLRETAAIKLGRNLPTIYFEGIEKVTSKFFKEIQAHRAEADIRLSIGAFAVFTRFVSGHVGWMSDELDGLEDILIETMAFIQEEANAPPLNKESSPEGYVFTQTRFNPLLFISEENNCYTLGVTSDELASVTTLGSFSADDDCSDRDIELTVALLRYLGANGASSEILPADVANIKSLIPQRPILAGFDLVEGSQVLRAILPIFSSFKFLHHRNLHFETMELYRVIIQRGGTIAAVGKNMSAVEHLEYITSFLRDAVLNKTATREVIGDRITKVYTDAAAFPGFI